MNMKVTPEPESYLSKAPEDEPLFVLRGQDMLAPALIRLWSELATMHGCPIGKTNDALEIADRMEMWTPRKFPD